VSATAGSDLVNLTCPRCGRVFLSTVYGVRAGRKWCSGICQDLNRRPALREATRRWKARRRLKEARPSFFDSGVGKA
jgi:hypothetical protein